MKKVPMHKSFITVVFAIILTVPSLAIGNDVIVDNQDGTATGAWGVSSWAPGYYGDNYAWHEVGSGGDYFTWTPTILTSGVYNVYAMWTADSTRAQDAVYTVYHNEGYTEVEVDQVLTGEPGCLWASLASMGSTIMWNWPKHQPGESWQMLFGWNY